MTTPRAQTDELQGASRERLLTEIGVLRLALQSERLEQLEQELNDTKQELNDTKQKLMAASDAVFGSSSELGELRVQLAVAKSQVQRARKRNVVLLGSTTWKLGYFLMAPQRAFRRVLTSDK